jgi:hypothetical protein
VGVYLKQVTSLDLPANFLSKSEHKESEEYNHFGRWRYSQLWCMGAWSGSVEAFTFSAEKYLEEVDYAKLWNQALNQLAILFPGGLIEN